MMKSGKAAAGPEDIHGENIGGGMVCPIPGGGQMRKLHDRCEEHPHWCFPLNEPTWVEGRTAKHMREDDPVVGIEIDGKAWALPWWVLKNHHVANLTLAGKPVMVMFCEVCTGAAAFDPVIDGKRHTFKLGGLYNGTGMPFDNESQTYWTGFSGLGIEGPLKDRTMTRFPILQCTWKEWRELHPDSKVPDGKGESREGHGEGQTPGSPFIGQYMGKLLSHLDTRLPYYELVLGLRAGGVARCYPLASLASAGGVVNDSVGGEDLVVFSRPGTWMAVAYRRQLEGRILNFRANKEVIEDAETGSHWDMEGRAVAGSLKGRRLEYVFSGVEEFFLWAAFNPKTEIHGMAGDADAHRQPAGAILDPMPEPLRRALDGKWIRPGMKVLVLKIRDGLIPAFLAEAGCQVLAIDTDARVVQAAQNRFRGVVRLRYERADLRRAEDPGARFDAIVDLGLIGSLPGAERRECVSTLAKLGKRDARVFVFAGVPAGKLADRQARMQKLFSPEFRLLDVASRGKQSGAGVTAFRFQRT